MLASFPEFFKPPNAILKMFFWFERISQMKSLAILQWSNIQIVKSMKLHFFPFQANFSLYSNCPKQTFTCLLSAIEKPGRGKWRKWRKWLCSGFFIELKSNLFLVFLLLLWACIISLLGVLLPSLQNSGKYWNIAQVFFKWIPIQYVNRLILLIFITKIDYMKTLYIMPPYQTDIDAFVVFTHYVLLYPVASHVCQDHI